MNLDQQLYLVTHIMVSIGKIDSSG